MLSHKNATKQDRFSNDSDPILQIEYFEEEIHKRNSKYLGYCLASSFFTLTVVVYLVILHLNLKGFITENFLWIYTFPVQFLAIFGILGMIHYKRKIKNWNANLASCVINTILLSLAIFGNLFFYLLDTKMDNTITLTYDIIFLPLDFLLIVAFFSICFILPGYFVGEKSDIIDAIILLVYFLVITTWIICMMLKLDGNIFWPYWSISSILYVGLITHALLLLIELKEDKAFNNILKQLLIIGWICLSLTLIMMNLNSESVISWNIVFIPLYIISIGFFIYTISDTFTSSRNHDNSV